MLSIGSRRPLWAFGDSYSCSAGRIVVRDSTGRVRRCAARALARSGYSPVAGEGRFLGYTRLGYQFSPGHPDNAAISALRTSSGVLFPPRIGRHNTGDPCPRCRTISRRTGCMPWSAHSSRRGWPVTCTRGSSVSTRSGAHAVASARTSARATTSHGSGDNSLSGVGIACCASPAPRCVRRLRSTVRSTGRCSGRSCAITSGALGAIRESSMYGLNSDEERSCVCRLRRRTHAGGGRDGWQGGDHHTRGGARARAQRQRDALQAPCESGVVRPARNHRFRPALCRGFRA